MRSPSCEMKADLKKGSWSQEEDEMLKAYIKRYGIWNWSHMPKFAGLSRSGKSCRLRWMNYLKPNVKKGNFTKEEEEIIIDSHSLLGNRWSAIASRIPGRTDNDIKNYWHTHLKKRVSQNLANGTTKQKDSKLCEASEVNKIQDLDNHVTDYWAWNPSSLTFEEDSSSSNCNNFSIDQVVEFKDDYYKIESPGTIDDLSCLWDQLCPIENLELIGSNHQELFSTSIFQDSYQDSLNLYG